MHYRSTRGRYAAMGLWLIVPAALVAIYFAYGTPHLILEYSFLDNGNAYDPWLVRTYTACTFVGHRGDLVTVPASNGSCGWVRFFKSGPAQ